MIYLGCREKIFFISSFTSTFRQTFHSPFFHPTTTTIANTKQQYIQLLFIKADEKADNIQKSHDTMKENKRRARRNYTRHLGLFIWLVYSHTYFDILHLIHFLHYYYPPWSNSFIDCFPFYFTKKKNAKKKKKQFAAPPDAANSTSPTSSPGTYRGARLPLPAPRHRWDLS